MSRKKSSVNAWRQAVGGREGVGRLETDSPGRDPGGLARVERVERVERVLEMSCSRLVGWQVCLG